MAAPAIHRIPVLKDNYVFLIQDGAGGPAAVVDPGEAGPVREALAGLGWTLGLVLLTHHHGDHTGGTRELKRLTGCTVVAGRGDAERIAGVDRVVDDGETVAAGTLQGHAIAVPGHTLGHVAYWFPEAKALFSGDTLFSLGCGRLFEGTAETMWDSLRRLRDLPDDTLVYCGHEYTNANADFAISVDPNNALLKRKAEAVLELRQRGSATVPSLLGEEKRLNPFLRADEPALGAAAGLAGHEPAQVFAALRALKDRF